jgi:hypothetical protein
MVAGRNLRVTFGVRAPRLCEVRTQTDFADPTRHVPVAACGGPCRRRSGEGSVSSPSMLNILALFVRIVRLSLPPEDVWGRAKRKQTRVMVRFRNCMSPQPRNRRPTAEPEKASQGARAELDIALPGPRTARSIFAAVVRIRHSPSPTLRPCASNCTLLMDFGDLAGLELRLTGAVRRAVAWHSAPPFSDRYKAPGAWKGSEGRLSFARRRRRIVPRALVPTSTERPGALRVGE